MDVQQKTSKMVVHPASIDMLVDTAWNFAHRTLWCNKSFGKAEIALAKFYIRQYYDNIPAKKFQRKALKRHISFCGRLLIVKEKSGGQLPSPCIFFDRFNPTGFFTDKNISNN